MLALGSPPGHRPGAVDHPGGREAGGGQGTPTCLAPLWSGWLRPLLRGPHAAALCRLHSAPGFLGPEVTPSPPPHPISIYKIPVQPHARRWCLQPLPKTLVNPHPFTNTDLRGPTLVPPDPGSPASGCPPVALPLSVLMVPSCPLPPIPALCSPRGSGF